MKLSFSYWRNSPHLWYLNVHYRVHKSLPPDPILRSVNAVHIIACNLLIIRSNIFIILSTGGFPNGFLLSPSPIKYSSFMYRSEKQNITPIQNYR